MDDGGLIEPVVAVPPRRLRQREVNLHLGAAEAKTFRRFGDVRRSVGGTKQASVELRRRHVADDGSIGPGGTAGGESHSGGASTSDDDLFDLGAGLADATVIFDEADERID